MSKKKARQDIRLAAQFMAAFYDRGIDSAAFLKELAGGRTDTRRYAKLALAARGPFYRAAEEEAATTTEAERRNRRWIMSDCL